MLTEKEINSIIESKIDKSPIFYGSIKIEVTQNRKKTQWVSEKVVMKGSEQEMKNSVRVKKIAIKSFLESKGSHKASIKKKVESFDLNHVIVVEVLIKKFLGYGVKEK